MKVLLIVYDDGAYVHTFPIGIAYITAVLKKKGYDVEIYNQDVHHYSEEHLAQYLAKNKFDIVGLGVIGGYYQYRKMLKIAKTVNSSKNRPDYFILGGHGPSPEPEYFMNITNADIVVIGEGEETIIDLVDAIIAKRPLSTVKGIAYRDGTKNVVNARRSLIKDIDTIPWPEYSMLPIEYYRMRRLPRANSSDFIMSVLSARGCTFKCNFCYRMDEGYRARSAEAILEEVAFLQKQYGINYIIFSDELLMSSRQRVENFCGNLLKTALKFKWYCNGRLNYAQPDILKLMREAGCVFINYGIEAFDDKALKNMKKGLTTKQIVKGIEATHKEDIGTGLNIIFGNIGENRETLSKGVDFLLKYSDCSELRTIRPVTPYPGSPLYYYAIEKELLAGVDDFYEKKHVNSDLLSVNFTDMSNDEFHESLMNANITLIEDYYQKKKASMIDVTKDLYLNRNSTFRGYRHK